MTFPACPGSTPCMLEEVSACGPVQQEQQWQWGPCSRPWGNPEFISNLSLFLLFKSSICSTTSFLSLMKWYDLAFLKHVYLLAFLYGAGWQAGHAGKLRQEDVPKLRVQFLLEFFPIFIVIAQAFYIFWCSKYCNYFGEDTSIHIYLSLLFTLDLCLLDWVETSN